MMKRARRGFSAFGRVAAAVVLCVSLAPQTSWAQDAPANDAGGAPQAQAEQSGAPPLENLSDTAASGGAPSTSATGVEPSVQGPTGDGVGDGSSASSGEGSGSFSDVSSDGASAQPESAPDATIQVACQVVGPSVSGDGSVSWAATTEFDVVDGLNAADLTQKALDANGLAHTGTTGAYGYFLSSIAAPGSDQQIGYDGTTGKYWQLFVNGQPSSVGASSVRLHAGDTVTWFYSKYGDKLDGGSDQGGSGSGSESGSGPGTGQGGSTEGGTDDGGSAGSAWAGFDSGAALNPQDAPTQSAKTEWTLRLKPSDDWQDYASDPVVVGSDLYVVVGDKLQKVDLSTGQVASTVQLSAKADSVSRMVVANGLLLVPLSSGCVQAVSLETMRTAWTTYALPDGANGAQQSLSTPLVLGNDVLFGTASADWTSTSDGYLGLLSTTSGAGTWKWLYKNATTGYYWAGAAKANGWVVVPDDAGGISTFSVSSSQGALGQPHTTLSLGQGVKSRSTAIAASDGTGVFVTTTDGVLHKVEVASDGSLAEVAHASFASSSTGTVAVHDGKVFVGGSATDGSSWHGVLAVFDEGLNPVATVSTLDDGTSIPGDVKSTPLVVSKGGEVWAYLTANNNPGGVYAYRLGDDHAKAIFTPAADDQNYCMGTVVADAQGTLYYVNDSGVLFKVVADESESGNGSGTGSGAGQGTESGQGPSSNPGSETLSDGGADSTSEAVAAQGEDEGFDVLPAETVPVARTLATAYAQSPYGAQAVSAKATGQEASQDGAGQNGLSAQPSTDAAGTSGQHDGASDQEGQAQPQDGTEQAASAGLPWLPWAGLAAGVVGLVVALYLRRS